MLRAAICAPLLTLFLSVSMLGCASQKCETQSPEQTAKDQGLRMAVLDWVPDESLESAKRHEVDAPEVDPYADLSEEERTEKARTLFEEAEKHAAQNQWLEAKDKYEAAYHLTPGRHGFALKVGMAAIEVGDCEKAKIFLEHFLIYGDLERQEALILEALRAHRKLECWHS
jgi:tetratricopeptide (TPR) repeat protein